MLSKSSVFCLVVLICSISHCNGDLAFTKQLFSDPNYYVTWSISADNSTLLMQLELETWAWVGIGWQAPGVTPDFAMTDGDFVVAEFTTDGELQVSDRYCSCSNGGSEPPNDTDLDPPGQYNILSATGMQYINSNGTQITSVTFERLMNTGDAIGDHPIQPGDQVIMFAFGQASYADPNTLAYHGPVNRGSTSLNFFSGVSSTTNESKGDNSLFLKYWHGCCMTVAFGFCMSLGVFFPRYLKSFWWWFPMHILIQITGVLLVLTGFVVITIAAEGNHYSNTHSFFGIFTIGIMLCTPLLGTMAHFMWNAARSKIPLFPDQFHWWFGRVTVISSWITIFLGMDLLGVPYQLMVAFGFVLLAYLTAYLWLDIMKIKEIGLKAYLFGAYTKKVEDPVLSDYY